ncbi:hypothetical protein ABFV67_11400 [Vibrio metschnikovii]|uniref:Uncharacterized protein n=1 Tax=bacterium 19PA01SH03 TaxID=2920705 RepID=A0AAU6SP48_UNCXX|nr:hypothetical protein [Vibrio metschnikovii]EKO3683602.1 hypothetical protein [Vibrio metschnikovii]EKO3739410.1 hypothetical protein [Vibrio metschnikovii]EKO3873009.1 hypothetical protein [Vibrio metschnikovii]EKO3882739.1 hypothetical protein [Vibrio metschnikovii]
MPREKLTPEQWELVKDQYEQGKTGKQLVLFVLNTFSVVIDPSTIYHRANNHCWERDPESQLAKVTPVVRLAHLTGKEVAEVEGALAPCPDKFSEGSLAKLAGTLEVLLEGYANAVTDETKFTPMAIEQLTTIQGMLSKCLAMINDERDRGKEKTKGGHVGSGVMLVGEVPTLDDFEAMAAEQQAQLKAEVKNVPQQQLKSEQVLTLIAAADALTALLPQLQKGSGTYQEMASDLQPLTDLAVKLKGTQYEQV